MKYFMSPHWRVCLPARQIYQSQCLHTGKESQRVCLVPSQESFAKMHRSKVRWGTMLMRKTIPQKLVFKGAFILGLKLTKHQLSGKEPSCWSRSRNQVLEPRERAGSTPARVIGKYWPKGYPPYKQGDWLGLPLHHVSRA